MPTDAERVDLLIDLRRYADAARAARDMIARAPDASAGYVSLARALHAQNDPDAIGAAQEGVRKAPRDAWPLALLACVLDHFGRHADALAPAEEAVRLNPRYAWGWSMLSRVLNNLGRYAESLAKAHEGLRLDPLSADLICRRGWAEYHSGNRAEAARTADEGLTHHPNSPALLNLLGYAKRGLAEATWGRARVRLHREADAHAREAVRLEPGQAVYRDNLRANALSCRLHLCATLVPLLYLVLCFVPVCALAAVFVYPVDSSKAVMLWIGTGVCLLAFCIFANTDEAALALPLARVGAPAVELTAQEQGTDLFTASVLAVTVAGPYAFLLSVMF